MFFFLPDSYTFDWTDSTRFGVDGGRWTIFFVPLLVTGSSFGVTLAERTKESLSMWSTVLLTFAFDGCDDSFFERRWCFWPFRKRLGFDQGRHRRLGFLRWSRWGLAWLVIGFSDAEKVVKTIVRIFTFGHFVLTAQIVLFFFLFLFFLADDYDCFCRRLVASIWRANQKEKDLSIHERKQMLVREKEGKRISRVTLVPAHEKSEEREAFFHI